MSTVFGVSVGAAYYVKDSEVVSGVMRGTEDGQIVHIEQMHSFVHVYCLPSLPLAALQVWNLLGRSEVRR